MRSVCPRVLLGLTLTLGACSSSEDGGNGNQAGSGGSGGSSAGSGGGRAGSGGSSAGSGGSAAGSGGSGGSAAGSGGAAGGAGGAMGGAGGAMGGSGGAMGDAGGDMGGAGGATDAGAPDMPPAQGMVKCGEMRPNLNGNRIPGINSAEGLVIGPDGTIYWTAPYGNGSNPNFLGRLKPPYDTPEPNWANIGGTALGITLDPKRSVIYVGRRSGGGAILKVTMTEPPMVSQLSMGRASVNGLTLGEDEHVYFTDQTGSNVYRVSPEGIETRVTTSNLPIQPNGLAFGKDNWLYVVPWSGSNNVVRFKVENGMEVAGSRENFASLGRANADGAAFDSMDNLYVTAGDTLYRISPAKQVENLGASHGANIEFGAGALRCTDVLVAGNGQGIRIHTNFMIPGADVPWHRLAM